MGPVGTGFDAQSMHNVVQAKQLRLGDKFMFSGEGDNIANDDWLRMFDKDGKGYYGGFAAGRLWTPSFYSNDLGTNFKGGVSAHNPQQLESHFPSKDDNKNYIRGDTEIQGNTNNVGDFQTQGKLCIKSICITDTELNAIKDATVARFNPFSSHTFTNAGATGRFGPKLSEVQKAYSNVAWAQDVNKLFVRDGIQEWMVPVSGDYTIIAAGAAGGGSKRGFGRVIRATVSLTRGELIKILVGQLGVASGSSRVTGGGGGASYIATSNNKPILVAPGGGGSGSGGQYINSVGQSRPINGNFAEGTDAAGASTMFGSGGASFTSNSSHKTYDKSRGGALSFINGGVGGKGGRAPGYTYGGEGGFGGGGGTCSCATGSGGGGGGYQGGDSGQSGGIYYTGHGGYSYYPGFFVKTKDVVDGGTNDNNHGYVTIKVLP